MGRLEGLRRTCLVAATLAAVVVAPAAGAPGHNRAAAQVDETPTLEVGGGSPLAPLQFSVSTAPAAGFPARIELDVPAGYAIDLSGKRGSDAGIVDVTLTASGGGGFAAASLELVVDDPTAYASDPDVQRCAPGAHAAAWRGTGALAGQNLRLLVFVDPAPGGGDTLLMCPSGLTGDAVTSAAVQVLGLEPLAVPTGSGTYVWRTLVTPQTGPVYELRALAVLPTSLTLKATRDVKRGVALMSGRLTAAGQPLAGQPIYVDAQVGNTTTSTDRAAATTTRDGRFTARRAIKKTTDYIAYVEPVAQACSARSDAPGGCLSETLVPPPSAFATVVIPRRGDAKRKYTRAGRTRAERELVHLSDLPSGFSAVAPPVHACGRHRSEARLTVTGEAQSPLYASLVSGSLADSSTLALLEVAAGTTVYRTKADARAAFGVEANVVAARCFFKGAANSGTVTTATPAFPQRPAKVRAFVDTIDEQGAKATLELVFVERGQSVASLIVGGIGTPSQSLALDLEQKLAGRLR